MYGYSMWMPSFLSFTVGSKNGALFSSLEKSSSGAISPNVILECSWPVLSMTQVSATGNLDCTKSVQSSIFALRERCAAVNCMTPSASYLLPAFVSSREKYSLNTG